MTHMTNTKKRIAYEITLNGTDGGFAIDGIEFPYHIAQDPEVVGENDSSMLAVTVTVFADNVTVTQKGSKPAHYANPAPMQIRASRDRARNIVRDRLEGEPEWISRWKRGDGCWACHAADNDPYGSSFCTEHRHPKAARDKFMAQLRSDIETAAAEEKACSGRL